MPVEGATIKFEDIEKKFSVIPVKELDVTKAFLAGDHWQGGDGWIGWKPELKTGSSEKDWRLIEEGFTPKNVIKGMTKRLRGAVLGKEPDWEIVPADREERVASAEPTELTSEEKQWKDIDEILTLWWAEKDAHKAMKDFIENYAAYGKASIQIYIPKGYLKAGADGKRSLNVTDAKDLAQVLSRIYVHVPESKSVLNVKDPDYGEDYVILRLAKKEASDEDKFQIEYLDENGRTKLRHVTQSKTSSATVSEEIDVDLGGNLMTCVKGNFDDAMISLPVKAQQRQLNHAKTMEGYALANINFPETTFINADLPIDEGVGPDGKAVKTLRPLWRGVGVFLDLVGLPIQKADGSEGLTTPEVIYKQPADPEKFAKVAENNTRDMHQEAGMVYILLSSSPYPSGESRIESMTDYLILLVDYKTLADNVGHWLLTTVLRLAFNFTGETDKNDKFKVIFSTKPTIGRVSTEDKKIMLQEVQARLRSKRNYMITTEVTDDPTLELGIISQEPLPEPDPNASGSATTGSKVATASTASGQK